MLKKWDCRVNKLRGVGAVVSVATSRDKAESLIERCQVVRSVNSAM